jgi:hypothetical protein
MENTRRPVCLSMSACRFDLRFESQRLAKWRPGSADQNAATNVDQLAQHGSAAAGKKPNTRGRLFKSKCEVKGATGDFSSVGPTQSATQRQFAC